MADFNLAERYAPHAGQMPFHLDAGKWRYRGLLGGTGCLPVDTLVWALSGLAPMNKVDEVLSWSFTSGQVVRKRAQYFPSGLKTVYVVETDVGDLSCSGEHRWFVSPDGLVVKRTEKLNTDDTLWIVRGTTDVTSVGTEQPMEDNRQRSLHRPLLQQGVQYSENSNRVRSGSEASAAPIEALEHSVQNLRGTVQNRERNREIDRGSSPRDGRRKSQKEQKELSEDSQRKLRVEVHDMRKNPDERALRLGSTSQRWEQQEQRSKEPDGSLSGLSLQPTLVRKITRLEEQVEMGDLHVEDTHNFVLSNGVVTHNSGKSLAGVAEDVYWCLLNPGIVGYIFEPTYKMIDRIVLPTLNQLLDIPFDANPAIKGFNRGRMSITFYNGSTLWLGSLDEPEQAEGPNVDFIHVDEARLVKPDRKFEEAWQVIVRRLRGSGGGHPTGAWVTTTPNWPGTFLHRFFEHPKHRDPEAKVYRMHIDDNLENLGKSFIEGMKRQHSGALYKRFIEGRFAGEETATFDFDYVTHVDGFRKPESGDIAFGVDFGWVHHSAVVAVLFDGDRRAYTVGEVYQDRLSTVDLIERCFKMQEAWGEGVFWCDASEPRTIKEMKLAGLKAKPCARHPGARDEGIREIGGRFRDAGDGRRRLYVSPDCVNLIDELQTYDAGRKEHDHAVDALRYCLMGERRQKYEPTFVLGPVRRVR